MPSYDQAKAQVEKIIGSTAKVPDVPSNISKALDDAEKAFGEFDKERDVMEDKILAYQNATSAFYNTLKMFSDKLSSSDYGADKKAADYKKKVAECQKIMGSVTTEGLKNAQINIKNAEELDKHMRNLSSYKSPKSVNI